MKNIRPLFLVVLVALVPGCSSSSGSSTHNPQATFHHNNREHRKWVADPSRTPKFKNQATGAPLFY